MAVGTKLQQFVADAFRGGATHSLREMFDIVGCQADLNTLTKVSRVQSFLTEWKLVCCPELHVGDENTERRYFSSEEDDVSESLVREELRTQLEGDTFELKSSIYHDHKRQKSQPDTQLTQLKSAAVMHSCLKTIAAFMNTDGGVLYVGVADDSNILGIEYDYRHLPCGKQNVDFWELVLRNHIRDRFKDGHIVGNYCKFQFIKVSEKTVARLQVFRRPQETYLLRHPSNNSGGYALYHRVGNSTLEVPVDQIIEFHLTRKKAFSYS